MRSVNDTYRTRSGSHLFRFRFQEQQNGDWIAYIASQPDYCGRPDDAHSTHRLSDSCGRYVCWTEPLQTLRKAKQVAATWCEKTEQYIRYGKKF
ncbi:hypothetical protein [Bythopirellula polymerisocia]|uniref:Uncharacterized protein n=1 Tax=Bythopirellula polymerisocia TaxID=2528003 RepID=A0A5C6CD47_9BACT|nr:hypothetical protein [Bythopirellula polymerisocia]TWU21306.1 hypothetical protein Pla144_47160 [Bythopirellula polymerisocia]